MKHLHRLLYLIVLLALPWPGHAARKATFLAADFEITVSRLNRGGAALPDLPLTLGEFKRYTEHALQPPPGQVFTISGHGTTTIGSIPVAVTFTRVKITYHPALNRFVLAAGNLTSDAEITYALEGCRIGLERGSFVIRPEGGEARVTLRYHPGCIAEGDPLALYGENIRVFPDGSVYGDTFTASAAFRLTGSSLGFTLSGTDQQYAAVGPTGSRAAHGLILHGASTLGRLGWISVIHFHTSRHMVDVRSRLAGPVSLHPSCGYRMDVADGEIRYQATRMFTTRDDLPVRPPASVRIPAREYAYLDVTPGTAAGRLSTETEYEEATRLPYLETAWSTDITGHLTADVFLPPAALAEAGNPIRFGSVWFTLGSDESVSATVTPPPFRLLPCIRVLPARESGWMYFAPGWYAETGNFPCEKDTACALTRKHLAGMTDVTRPGLTVQQGSLEYELPQVDRHDRLHSPFWGSLTFVPYGLTGKCTSGGFSLMPEGRSDTVILLRNPEYDLQQIIGHGNRPPPEPEPVFTLSGLPVLDMTLDSLTVCHGRLQASKFNYTVHFPHPSYINIDFADQSLDEAGWFDRAYGPDLQGDQSIEEIIALQGTVKPHERPVYNARGSILWFWHLPVLFYERGTEIIHAEATARVNIHHADFMIAPLANRDTSRKGGISFRGNLTPRGEFTFYQVDSTNAFGRTGNPGFTAYLKTLDLAGPHQAPESRPYDARWTGEVLLPFFGRQHIEIFADDLIPYQQNRIARHDTGVAANQARLRIITEDLTYQYDQGRFTEYGALYAAAPDGHNYNLLESGHLIIRAYTDGIILNQEEPDTLEVGRSSGSDACGRPAVYKELLIYQSGNEDIVCYDEEARSVREGNDPEASCAGYLVGDLLMTSDDVVVWKVPGVRYYPDSKKVETASAESAFSPAENNLEVDLDLQAVKLYVQDGVIVGDLAMSTEDFPLALPVSGEASLQFKVNTDCGYFYCYSAASLQFGYSFNGMVFIAHDLFRGMDSAIGSYENPVEKVRKNIYVTRSNMLDFLGHPADNELLTGFIGTGGVGIGVIGFDVTLKGGFFYFNIHTFAPEGNRNRMGIINSVLVVLDLPGAEAAVSVNITAYGSTLEPEAALSGTLCFCGCLEADTPFGSIGYLMANASVGCRISTTEGFSFDAFGFGADLGFGDCPCSEDPCPR